MLLFERASSAAPLRKIHYEIHCNICSILYNCAADFALLNLPKGKSLGRSKPATNSSNEQAH
jgi:hypothetical protein